MFKTALIAMCFISTTVQANQLVVEAFYDQDTQIINVDMAERVASVTTYDLSAPEKFEDALSEGLSSDPAIAQKQAKQRIEQRGNQIQKQLQTAYEGALKAMQYNIDKLPAIVFNKGQHVIYGVNDVNKAVSLYNNKAAHQ